jgi:hypothetical protein
MLKFLLAPALCLCLLVAVLPAAFSAPAKDPGQTLASKTQSSGVTQISFTRVYPEYDPGHGWDNETVTFNVTPFGYTATRVLTGPPPNDTGRETPGQLLRQAPSMVGFDASDNARLGATGKLIGQFQGRVDCNDSRHLTNRNDLHYFAGLLASTKFFEGPDYYGAAYPIFTSPFVSIRVIRNGTQKTVTLAADSAPPEMWALWAALRGVASDVQWHKVEKTADAGGVKAR